MIGMARFLFSILLLLTTGMNRGEAADAKTNPKESAKIPEKQVPPVMYEFLGEMVRLQPFMVSEEKFSDAKNDAEIAAHLKNLTDISKRLNHSQRLNTSSFQITASSVQDHLGRLHSAYHAGRKEYARRMLKATLTGCGSCHTQVPSQKMQWKFKPSELQGTHFDRGEFLFAVRHYDEALEEFDAFLKSATKNSGRNLQMGMALHRKLAIFVRIMNDPARAITSFEKDLKNPSLQPRLKNEVQGWIAALKDLPYAKTPNPATAKVSEVEAFAASMLKPLMEKGFQFEPKHYVTFLNISGLLFQSINSRPESELTPGALYWLALCDTRLNEDFFFSFGDEYLKECISRFPSTETAQKCFSELEASTEISFTGSGGVQIPDDVKKELQRYKGMLKPKL